MGIKRFFKEKIQSIIYAKNNFVLKYTILHKRKLNGEKVTIKDYLIEFNLIKKETKSKNNKNTNIQKEQNKSNKKDKEPKEKQLIKIKKVFCNIATALSFVLFSFGFSIFFFNQADKIFFFKVNEDNEYKIMNTLESPKTKTYINTYYNDELCDVEYIFVVIDDLDSYSYRLKFQDVSNELKNELLKSNATSLERVESLEGIIPNTIVEYQNNYLVNDQYIIDEAKISDTQLSKINSNIKETSIARYNNAKMLTITILTTILSLVSNSMYFIIKKVISKK